MCEETIKVVATVFKKFLVVYGGFSEHILGKNRREICYPQGKVNVATRAIQWIKDGQLLGRKNRSYLRLCVTLRSTISIC